MLEKTLQSPFETKEIKPVNSTGDQSWIFIRVTDTIAEAPILWKSDEKRQLFGKDWCLERLKSRTAGVTEDEMVGWSPELSGHEFEQTPGDNEGQGSLVCCSPWGYRVEHDLVTEQQWQFMDDPVL